MTKQSTDAASTFEADFCGLKLLLEDDNDLHFDSRLKELLAETGIASLAALLQIREHLTGEGALYSRSLRIISRWAEDLDKQALLDFLGKMLADPSPRVRHEAASALGALGDRSTQSRLEEALDQEPHPAIRQTIALALRDVSN